MTSNTSPAVHPALSGQRDRFDIPSDVTYLNCANMAPQLRAVAAAGLGALRTNATPWTRTSAEWFSGPERLRALAARIMNASTDSVALVPSASYGIATAAANVPVAAGQRIVLLDQQFPSNVYAWRALAARRGAHIHTVMRGTDGTWTENVLAAIDERTAVVSVPNGHWTDGSLIDLRRVGAKARAVGAAFMIDASQSLGAYPTDVLELQPDFLVAVGYKWMLGPYGLGYLYVAPRWQEQGTPFEHSWLSRAGSENFSRLVDYTDEHQPGARRFDAGEYPQLHLVPMAIAALEQILEWGVDRIQQSLSVLTQQAQDGARALGCSALPAEHRLGHLIGIRLRSSLPDGFLQELGRRLGDAKVYLSIRGDSLRIAPHLHCDASDVERLLAVLSSALR